MKVTGFIVIIMLMRMATADCQQLETTEKIDIPSFKSQDNSGYCRSGVKKKSFVHHNALYLAVIGG